MFYFITVLFFMMLAEVVFVSGVLAHLYYKKNCRKFSPREQNTNRSCSCFIDQSIRPLPRMVVTTAAIYRTTTVAVTLLLFDRAIIYLNMPHNYWLFHKRVCVYRERGGMGLCVCCMWSCSTHICMCLSRSNRVHQIIQSITCAGQFQPGGCKSHYCQKSLPPCRRDGGEKKKKQMNKKVCLICCKMP